MLITRSLLSNLSLEPSCVCSRYKGTTETDKYTRSLHDALPIMQNASSGAGSVSEVQSQQGYAECVVQSTSEATIVAAVVGIATGPGQTAVIPITMVASLTVFGISCAY